MATKYSREKSELTHFESRGQREPQKEIGRVTKRKNDGGYFPFQLKFTNKQHARTTRVCVEVSITFS